MLQRNVRRYWRFFAVLAVMATVILVLSRPSRVRGDVCYACDEKYYICVSQPNCDSNCVSACQSQNSSCNTTCNYYATEYHYSPELTAEQEIQMCLKMGHRTAFRQCMAGNPMYSEAYSTCINGASSAEDCCYDQESLYDWDNCW